MRMHVALVSPFDPFPSSSASSQAHVGGVERVFQEVSKRLVDKGHRVSLVCSSEKKVPESVEEGVLVRRVRRSGTLLRAPVAPYARHLPPDADVVHTPATYPFTTPQVLRRASRLGIPSVLDFHFEPVFDSMIGKAAARFNRRFGTSSYTLARNVIVRSYDYGRASKSLDRVPEDRWRVVPNGIDTERFGVDGPAPDEDYMLFVGRLVPYKGIHVLLEALDACDEPLPLWIAGNGPLRKRLEHEAERKGLDVRFLGHVPDEDLPALYRGARFTLMPSINGQEAFGISLVESMACGTPVVASGLPGVASVARLGGLVARPRDVGSLARQIHQATHDADLPRGRVLADEIHRSFSWDAVTERLLDVYHEVLGQVEQTSARSTAYPMGTPLSR